MSRTLAIALSISVTTCFACYAELTLQDIVPMLEDAATSIWSYDVYLRVERRWPMTFAVTRIQPLGDRDFPAGEWRPLKPGEAGKHNVRVYRQVYHGHKRRLESRNPEDGEVQGIKVTDGELEIRSNPADLTGLISGPTKRFLNHLDDYELYYREVINGLPLVKFLARRTNVSVDTSATTNDLGPGLIVIHAPAGSSPLPSYGARIWIDPDHGMHAKRIELYRGEVAHLWRRITVLKFHAIPDGAWVPVDVQMEMYQATPEETAYGKMTHVRRATIDLSRSSWNHDVPDETFQLKFPLNTRVSDELRQITFITGAEGRADNVDSLLKDAREIYTHGRRSAVQQPVGARRLVFWANLALAVIVVALGGIWMRKQWFGKARS